MKKMILTMVAALAVSVAVQAKTVKTTFKVGGNCTEMCKPRIEKAAKQVPGVVSAKWNQKTQQLALVYDNTKTNSKKVQKAIAATGHDAGNIKASDATYAKLPGCCQYRK
ncbi:MAG: heavy-metal-associated domain-containing protein [Prevotella sp.]|nr:heavy-metal-associated domain-containing protein [Prevotella sp.]